MKTTTKAIFAFGLFSLLFYYLFDTSFLSREDIYEKCIRWYIFSAFLGIGSFVFTLMTAMLFTMKDKIYSDEEYLKIFKKSKSGMAGNTSKYAPLTDIGRLFIFIVFCCLGTAAYQISFGLIKSDITAAFGMAAAFTTLCLIFYVVYKVKRTMEVWFSILEDSDHS